MKNVWIFIIVFLLIVAAFELTGGLHALVLHPFKQHRMPAGLSTPP